MLFSPGHCSDMPAVLQLCRTGFNKVGAFIVMLPAIALGTFALLGTLLLVFGGFSV
jgi:hypothetical protein